jgi:5-methylcytosine-specific restriction enzyme A
MPDDWSLGEIDAAFEAYVHMIEQQKAGRAFVKAEVIRDLRAGPLQSRSKGSVERRFQNFSHLFQERGLEWLSGYVPLAHVGLAVERRVEFLMERARP